LNDIQVKNARSSGKALPAAIVVGLDCMTGLQTARILAGHQIPVIGISSDPDHYCSRTRVCERQLAADTASDELIQALISLGPELQEKAVLIPCTDMSVLLISRSRERLQPWYQMMLPEAETVEMLMDKNSFFSFAREAQLPIPKTFLLRSRSEAEEASAELSYPCILKPPIKTRQWQENTNAKVFRVSNAEELLELYDRCSAWAEVLMVQEWIEGTDADLYSCNCYFSADSEPLATFIARKLRQWPPRTGTSCLGEEVRNDVVLEESLNLFRSVNYRGLGYVEMKRDARTGKHYIIEPNIGRPTGRSAIAEAGGVDLLFTMYCDLTGRPLPSNREQKYGGVKWIYWRRDIQSALYYWRKRELSIREWWQSWRGRKAPAVFSWTDPAPFIADLFRGAGILFGRNRGKVDVASDGIEEAPAGADARSAYEARPQQ
jgi:predicted ATP-grasp superfamily ATP-dependent carboligase